MTRKIALEEALTTPATKDYLGITLKIAPSQEAADALAQALEDSDQRIAAMDDAGIDLFVLSQTSPGVQAEKDASVAVEPTNNAAERPLRRAVLWRRKSFGTQSASGSLFVGRVLTAVESLRQQGRDVLEYLAGVCRDALSGKAREQLIPVPCRTT